MADDIIKKYADRVGYSQAEVETFQKSGHCVRQIRRLAEAAPKYSIQAEIVSSKHCNSGHAVGQKFILDVDGNFITKLCPKRLCVYLISQFTVPVALINERLNEGLEPNDFHFMRHVRCPDTGVECLGYGEVTAKIEVIPRVK